MKYTVELDDNFAKALTAASNHDPVSPEYRGDVALAIAALVRMHVRAVLGDTASRAAIQNMLDVSAAEHDQPAEPETKH